jgi:hypothetical protein
MLDGASWETEPDGAPGRFTFRILDDPDLRISEGDRVSVSGTASELLRRIAVGHRLEVGRVDDTGVVLPEIVEDNKTLADVIHNALRKTEEMGGGTGFLRTISIDKDTYNNVKLVRDTKNGREFFTASDAGNQAQWGKLQYLAKADEEEDAQAKANSLLNLYNKEQRTHFSAVGEMTLPK